MTVLNAKCSGSRSLPIVVKVDKVNGWLGAGCIGKWADEGSDQEDNDSLNVPNAIVKQAANVVDSDSGCPLPPEWYEYVPPSQAELAHNAALMAKARRYFGVPGLWGRHCCALDDEAPSNAG